MIIYSYSDTLTSNQLAEYYKPSSNSTTTSNLVSMYDVYELVNEIRKKRGETLIDMNNSNNSNNSTTTTQNSFCTVYATDVSLLNCWGLIELDRV